MPTFSHQDNVSWRGHGNALHETRNVERVNGFRNQLTGGWPEVELEGELQHRVRRARETHRRRGIWERGIGLVRVGRMLRKANLMCREWVCHN